jgi:hypothetical protein
LLKLGDPSLGGSNSSLREPEVLPRSRARAAAAAGQRLFQEYSPRCRANVARPWSLRCAHNRLSVVHKYPTEYASRLPRFIALFPCIGEHLPPQRALNIHGWQCDSFSSLTHADPRIRVRVTSESTTCLLDGFVSLPRFPCSTQRVTPSELGLGGTGQSPYTTLIGPMVERLAVVPPAASALANGTRRQPSSEPRPPLVTTPLSCSPHRDTAATDMDRHAVGAAHRRALAAAHRRAVRAVDGRAVGAKSVRVRHFSRLRRPCFSMPIGSPPTVSRRRPSCGRCYG